MGFNLTPERELIAWKIKRGERTCLCWLVNTKPKLLGRHGLSGLALLLVFLVQGFVLGTPAVGRQSLIGTKEGPGAATLYPLHEQISDPQGAEQIACALAHCHGSCVDQAFMMSTARARGTGDAAFPLSLPVYVARSITAGRVWWFKRVERC